VKRGKKKEGCEGEAAPAAAPATPPATPTAWTVGPTSAVGVDDCD
jgi:hypothetical protein